jgi:uncharacterized protein with HEPN domain
MPKDDKTRLRHMLEQGQKVLARATSVTREDLNRDDDLSAAIVWRLSVIGEAAAFVTDETCRRHPDVPWQQIVGMRHRLIHGYDSIDLEIVWQTIQVDLPPLVSALQRILDR